MIELFPLLVFFLSQVHVQDDVSRQSDRVR